MYVDPDGRKIIMFDDNYVKWTYYIESGSFEDAEGNKYTGSRNDFINTVTQCLNYLCEGEAGRKLVSDLAQRKEGICILYDKNSIERGRFSQSNNGIKSVVKFNPDEEVECTSGGVILGHELAHSQDRLNGTMMDDKWLDGESGSIATAERYSMHWENLIRKEHGIPLRQYYAGTEGKIYELKKDECVSLYFDSKYPINVNYKNILPKGVKGYVYKSLK